jgi:hypothetical protein
MEARACANSQPQIECCNMTDASLPTVKTELVLFTAIIHGADHQTAGVYNNPGTFLHTKLNIKVHMKVAGILESLLLSVAPYVNGPHVTHKKRKWHHICY